jgi:hypothetical protein
MLSLAMKTAQMVAHAAGSSKRFFFLKLAPAFLQVRSKLLHVSDLLALGRTTIEEAHRLLLWAKLEGTLHTCVF